MTAHQDRQPQPLFRTPEDQLDALEHIKRNSNYVKGNLYEQVRDLSATDLDEQAAQLAKSHGIYLEYNRAKTGREKDWMFMVRISVPGGGAFNRQQWHILNEAADRFANANPYSGASIRLTTRQNIQFHWVKKPQLIALVQYIARTGFFTLNGCGDNVRNVMGCPLSKFSTLYDAHAKAQEYGRYFRLPPKAHIEVFAIDPDALPDPNAPREPDQAYDYGPQLLNRKFKIAFSAVQRDPVTGQIEYDNCVECRTNEVGVCPIVEHGKVVAYQVYIGGSQGEKNGKPTFAALGVPFGIFTEENLRKGLHDIVKVHEVWGDRKHRHWARLKYVVHRQGIEWYRQQVRELGAQFELPDPHHDPGPRMMHHGWTRQESNGLWAYGAYIECGRLVDSTDPDADREHRSGNVTGNGRLKSMVPAVLDAFDGVEVMITPNQDLLFTNIPEEAKEDFLAKLVQFGYGQRRGKAYSQLRVLSGACVGLPTCRLSYTDSEQFEPELIDQLEQMGYGQVRESIGITGCERQCFRPATKTIGLVGQGPGLYALKLGGSEDARHQGVWLTQDDRWYLRQIPRDRVAGVCAALFDYYFANRLDEREDMGACVRRVGTDAIIAYLKVEPRTTDLMQKTYNAPYLPDDQKIIARGVAPAQA